MKARMAESFDDSERLMREYACAQRELYNKLELFVGFRFRITTHCVDRYGVEFTKVVTGILLPLEYEPHPSPSMAWVEIAPGRNDWVQIRFIESMELV